MASPQPGIFALGARDHVHLEFRVDATADPADVRAALAGLADDIRDRLTDFSRAVSGSYWFVPSVEDLLALETPPESPA